jgi:hypothetical protein
MAHLDANSGGLHAINMISLRMNMTQYYVQADGIPQFIVMMGDAQMKAKQAGMPIADVELVMMASATILSAQHFPQEVDDLEGLLAIDRTWRAWKVAFHLAHLKRQCQLQASGVGGPLGSTHTVTPAPAATIDRLGTALDNLALTVAKDTPVLRQLTASNLALSSLVTMLTTANKKLVDALAKAKSTSPLAAMPGAPKPCGPPTHLSQATTVGVMAINSSSNTQAQCVATKPRVTRTMRLLQTRWGAAKPKKVGTLAPDGVGGQI